MWDTNILILGMDEKNQEVDAWRSDEIRRNQMHFNRSLPLNLAKQHPSTVLGEHFLYSFGASDSEGEASIHDYLRVVRFALDSPFSNGIRPMHNRQPALLGIF